ncbi:MAG: hypothetical protein JXR10_18210 [Cyclobacteriaceae bacterium]
MAQNDVKVHRGKKGFSLIVDGQPFIVNGINWDYIPIGTNYSYDFWNQPDEMIITALDAEMSLLRDMGVNAIRQYIGVPPRWIEYIYQEYQIFTMINHSFGRYGLTINGDWVVVTDYSSEDTHEILLSETKSMVESYKDTPGLLLFLLGNENNYGLFWAGGETEDFPEDDQVKEEIGEQQGRPMYRLMNEAALQIKSIDQSHPVAICNGDLVYLDIIAEECTDIDIYGVNMYRGLSFGDAFERVKKELDKPLLFTEFGSDAYHAIAKKEDQEMQAYYLLENWKEIYQNVAGAGKAGNSIGGFTFQFSDGWWKFGQTKNLSKHDTNASWVNAGYSRDFERGENNMNEEWFGICAKGPSDENGLYSLFPRAAYYCLQEVHSFNPLTRRVNLKSIEKHFENIELEDALEKAEKQSAALEKIIMSSSLMGEFGEK